MWLVATFSAAVFQTARTALQHRLRAALSRSGAGFVRYVYGAPIALAAVAVIAAAGVPLPSPPWRFWPIIAAAGLAQIVATVLLIGAFEAHNFAIGTVYSKTEIIQTALFSVVLLGEGLSALGWAATVTCFTGIAILAMASSHGAWPWSHRAARLGLGAGACFAVAAVGIRAASVSLGDHPAVVRALIALAVMNTMQTVMHGGYLAAREHDQLRLAVTTWRSSAIVGVLSVCGSASWALAFTLQNASRVRTVGQVELLWTFLVAHFWFHERHSRREWLACCLIVAGLVGAAAAQ
jgi:drug/metabolite transporter (DMT)-like permease